MTTDRNDLLRELCGESDGFVKTNHLSRLIEDPCMLKMAIDTLDSDHTGKIPFEKLENLLNITMNQELTEIQRSCSSSDDPDGTFQEYDCDKTDDDSTLNLNFSDSGSPILARRSTRKLSRPRRVKGDRSSDSGIEDLSEQVKTMKSKIYQIEEADQLKADQLESTKIENIKLCNRLHELEDYLRDVEVERDHYRSKYEELSHSHGVKVDKETKLRTEIMEQSTKELNSSLSRLQNDYAHVKGKNEKYKSELQSQSRKLDEYQTRTVEQIEKYQQLTERSAAEREELLKQNNLVQAALDEHKVVLEDTQRQNEELKSRVSRQIQDVVDISDHTGNNDFLKAENDHLQQLVDDLNIELLNQHVARTRALSNPLKGDCFANELDDVTKDEVDVKYKKLYQTHEELKSYLDKILTNVIERDPTLLEVRA